MSGAKIRCKGLAGQMALARAIEKACPWVRASSVITGKKGLTNGELEAVISEMSDPDTYIELL